MTKEFEGRTAEDDKRDDASRQGFVACEKEALEEVDHLEVGEG